jgi:hypothetical protein
VAGELLASQQSLGSLDVVVSHEPRDVGLRWRLAIHKKVGNVCGRGDRAGRCRRGRQTFGSSAESLARAGRHWAPQGKGCSYRPRILWPHSRREPTGCARQTARVSPALSLACSSPWKRWLPERAASGTGVPRTAVGTRWRRVHQRGEAGASILFSTLGRDHLPPAHSCRLRPVTIVFCPHRTRVQSGSGGQKLDSEPNAR